MSANPNKPVDWDRLLRLFRPGSGVMPPELAGRDRELKTLSRFRADLAGKRPPPSDVILYGPRGNGKTVLLRWLEREAKKQGRPRTLWLTPKMIPSGEALAEALGWKPKRFFKGFSGALAAPRRGAPGLAGLLAKRAGKRGLVLLLDEAHTLDVEVGGLLLDASQMARGGGAPFFLALAGTPGLLAQLRATGASFWDRSKMLGVGRLDKEAAREALAVPLKKHGVDFGEDALAEVVEESQRYPFFLQVWGAAVCRALAERKATRVTAEIVALARPAFERKRTALYEGRYRELLKSGLLPAAEAAAGGFAEARAEKRKWTLRDAARRLRADLGLRSEAEAAAEMERLSHLGLVWQPPGSEHLEAGIPSLMDHVSRKAAEHGHAAGEAPGASPAP